MVIQRRDRSPPDPLALVRRSHDVSARARLPASLTSFVGREREILAIRDLLRQPGVRLLTLVGAGGVGKTRVALEVARQSEEDFPEGIWFVPLAEVRSPALVASAIAQAFGVHELGSRSLAEGIAAVLHGKHALLVLDNFEHVIDAAPLVVELLAASPWLTCLVTSRAVLRISGEHAFPLPPLPLPPSAERTDAERASGSPAVRLFVSRAKAAQPGFALSDDNASEIEAICRRLDGLPLAIELAAARIRHLSLAALLRQLTDEREASSLRMLIGGPRDAPDRQRALRHAIAWSYALLTPDEEALFRRLAVFVGGFTLDAAEAVSRPSLLSPSSDFFELLASLADQSLLRHVDGPGGESRYAMLETVREFGLEELAAAEDEVAALQAHAAYYLALVERAAPELHGEHQLEWVARLKTEYANIRAALDWFGQEGQGNEVARIGWALFWFWKFQGHYIEGQGWYERALETGASLHPLARQAALIGASHYAWVLGDVKRSENAAREALALEETHGEAFLPGAAELMLSRIIYWQGDAVAADAIGDRALARLREVRTWAGDVMLRIALNDVGMNTARAGNGERGIALLEEALTLVEGTGDLHLAGVHWSDLGLAAQAAGDRTKAERCFLKGLRVHHAAGAEWYLATSLAGLATCSDRRDPAWTARLLGAAESLRKRSGQPNWPHERDRDARTVARVRTLLGDEGFIEEYARGGAMPLDEVVALALTGADEMAPSPRTTEPLDRLSPREREVLQLLVAGMTDQEIADTLFISRRTASKHVGAILAKLDVGSRSEAAQIATREGLV
jgi:predicted ATPase/DNA-binding CsgD family transcriptional regulator